MVCRKLALHLRQLDASLKDSADSEGSTIRVNGTQFCNVGVTKAIASARWNDIVFSKHTKLLKLISRHFSKKSFSVEWSL